ncbi:hypothetical protein JWH11_17570 [Xanthomonas melonis]|uniref:Uncharacterized protein n=1 Tax=Xanthomonas melonis TaxID=56456 RepID=A0ABS8NZ49_9XANT|nr:hypothetical protein [Xanthomonas melonis]MCD0259626.1 hypothetical protein [Xanthomonas melonis]MCD0268203.1 hypothetical protein [Xanthomonas melonis]
MSAPMRPALSRLWLSEPDGGLSLQLSACVDGSEQALVTVSADPQDDTLWVTLPSGDAVVQVPLATLRQLLEVASEEVHSANWFARQASD